MLGARHARATASISDARKKVRDRQRELSAQRACVDHHAHEALGSSGSSACASCASNSQPRLRAGSSTVACSLRSPRFALAIRVDDARRRWSRERSRDVELRPTEYLTAMQAFAWCWPHHAGARLTVEPIVCVRTKRARGVAPVAGTRTQSGSVRRDHLAFLSRASITSRSSPSARATRSRICLSSNAP
jgi:hypothetical protein